MEEWHQMNSYRPTWDGQEDREDEDGVTLPHGQHGWTRREVLTRSGMVVAVASVATTLGLLSSTTSAHAAALVRHPAARRYAPLRASTGGRRATAKRSSKRHAGSSIPHFNHPYFHATFTVNSVQDAELAASLGINYTISYAQMSWASADPNSDIGQTLARLSMKTFLNVENPFLTCSHGQGQLDEQGVRDLVGRLHQSPLIAGYWTKDDDCGYEANTVRQLYQLIRSIDPNPNHLIMPGFSDAGSVNRNYAPGQGDVLAFYPYPAYSRGPAVEVPRMLNIVRSRTPRGQNPPPFIGIYQAFGNPPRQPTPSSSAILDEVYTYVRHGAIGVGGYGVQGNRVDIGNNANVQHAVANVSAYLHGH